MTGHPDLSAIVGAAAAQKGLRLRSDIQDAGWTFWELRTINRHRVIGLLAEPRTYSDTAALGGEIRAAIGRHFKRAWWRGLGFGVVAIVETTWTPDDIATLVDDRENPQGVLQWLVTASPDGRHAVGAHTWERVFLSPAYTAILDALATGGYQVGPGLRT
jgi:hypothetical protein